MSKPTSRRVEFALRPDERTFDNGYALGRMSAHEDVSTWLEREMNLTGNRSHIVLLSKLVRKVADGSYFHGVPERLPEAIESRGLTGDRKGR